MRGQRKSYPAPARDKIVAILEANQQGLTCSEIAREGGYESKSVSRRLSEYEAVGAMHRMGWRRCTVTSHRCALFFAGPAPADAPEYPRTRRSYPKRDVLSPDKDGRMVAQALAAMPELQRVWVAVASNV